MKHDNDNHTLTYLSVCSGIEAASVAWHPLGWRAAAYSEIEKFPSAVLAHHYPDVPNLGDFTKIDTSALGQVDILAGGTPCQAFSVAGLRQGLDDARGNLTLKFVELAHELADGNGLRNVVWENVVGVLSDKGNAFGCFLAGLVGANDPILPPGRWTNAGMVSGPRGRAAWRVLDAQYFGVAQRRRRVIVVADFGNGADPAAVLLIEQGLPRHPPTRGETGKDVAGTAASGAGGGGIGVDYTNGLIQGEISGTLEAAQSKGNRGQGVIAYTPEIALCVATREGSSQDYETTTMVAVDVAPTMRAGGNRTGGDRPYGTDVDTCDSLAISYRIAGDGAAYEEGDRSAPLTTGTDQNANVIAIPFDTTQITSKANRSAPKPGDPCHPLNAQAHPPAITVALRGRDGGATAELGGPVATALRASQGGGDKPHVLAFDTYNQTTAETAATVRAGGGPEGVPAVLTSAVRRLTPMECERLQGFPDGYTDIPWRGKPSSPDGPRYKALGNSWAVPKFAWLGHRLAAELIANDNQKRSDDNSLAA